MVYIALLRGINVGGNSKVDMKVLKKVFEDAGLQEVKTYINSGNVIFKEDNSSKEDLVKNLETAIEHEFGFYIKVLIKDFNEIKEINNSLPKDWVNDNQMKCDVMFLWEDVDKKEVLNEVIIKSEIDDVKYVNGAILWRVDRDKVTKSGMLKIVGTKLYKQMTIRNCNTLRKVYKIMQDYK